MNNPNLPLLLLKGTKKTIKKGIFLLKITEWLILQSLVNIFNGVDGGEEIRHVNESGRNTFAVNSLEIL